MESDNREEREQKPTVCVLGMCVSEHMLVYKKEYEMRRKGI